MRKHLLLIAASLALLASPAAADWTGKNAAGATITFSNPVDCTSGTCIPIAALVTAAGATLYGTAGSSNTAVLSVQGIASGTALPISGTVTATPTGTQAISAASASYASGAFSSGSFASGSVASGAFASGALASGSIAAGAMVDLLTMRGTVAAGTAAANSMLTGCVYNSTPITLSNGQQAAVQCSVNGYPTVTVSNTNANGQATMANSSPVVIASNQTANALWGQGATGAAVPANAQYMGFNSGGNLTAPATATPLPVRQSDGTNVAALDPCQSETKSTLPITLATAAVKVIAVGVSAKKIYVCQIHLTNNAADSVAVFEATTGTTCATSAVAVVGAGTSVASAATGYNFAANGGISLGTGASQVLQTATNANDLCIAQSAATQLTGSITYVTR